MTYTRTYTLEERALEALCARSDVRLVESGVIGRIKDICDSDVKEGVRRIGVLEYVGRRMHWVDLTSGVVEYL